MQGLAHLCIEGLLAQENTKLAGTFYRRKKVGLKKVMGWKTKALLLTKTIEIKENVSSLSIAKLLVYKNLQLFLLNNVSLKRKSMDMLSK